MSETKIKRPKCSELDPAGVLGIPLLNPRSGEQYGFIPQKFVRFEAGGDALYTGVIFGIASVFSEWHVCKPFGKHVFFDSPSLEWVLGFGDHMPPDVDGLYLFPQNDNEEFMDDELERLDKREIKWTEKELADAAGHHPEGNVFRGQKEAVQKEKRFKLACALLPSVYEQAIIDFRNGGISPPPDDWEKGLSGIIFRMTDAMLEAEGE